MIPAADVLLLHPGPDWATPEWYIAAFVVVLAARWAARAFAAAVVAVASRATGA